MSDPASQANELRLLEQKRIRTGLSPEEEARRAALSGAIPAPARSGFVVKAAAAQVRALMDAAAPPPPGMAPAPPKAVPAPPEAAPTRLDATAAAPAPALAPALTPDPAPALTPTPALTPPVAADAPPAAPPEPFAPGEDPPSVPDGGARSAGALDLAPDPGEAAPEPGAAPIAPVYDAAAYGLDPDDPDAAAWVAWYAEQGWDPATAYAYAQEMNAEHEQEASGAKAQGEDSTSLVAANAEELIAELPPPELEVLDGAVDEPAPVVLEEPSVSIDLELPFGSEAPAEDGAPPEEVALPVEVVDASAAAAPAVDWSEHALPASDDPVDFTAFEAEPASDAGEKEPGSEAEQTVMWELPAAPRQEPADRAELSIPEHPDLPPLDEYSPTDLAPVAAVEMPWSEAPGEDPPLAAAAGILGARAAEFLEQPPAGLVEVEDDDILEVGEDVVEFAEATPPAAADLRPLSGAAPPEEPALPALDIGPLDAVEAVDQAPPAPLEPTLAFGARPPIEAAPEAIEPPALIPAWNAADEPLREPEPRPLPIGRVSGTHRVVIHTADGQVKRGTVSDVALDSGEVLLAVAGELTAEPLPVEQIKAIFFMLPPGAQPVEPEGRKVRVTFRDGRQVAGYSADYDAERTGFFMVPADTRTHTARIWVYRSAVRQVSVS